METAILNRLRTSKVNLLFFALGAGAFTYLVIQFSLNQVVVNIHRAGLSLLYAILVWFVIYLLNTLAWKTVLGGIGTRLPFVTLFMVTVSAFSINTVTPIAAVGGEPYKVKILSDALGTHRSFSAVLLYRMVYFFGHMLSILAGIVCGIVFFDLPATLQFSLFIVFLLIGSAVFWGLSIHKRGIFERFMNWVQHVRILHRLFFALEVHRETFRTMDSVLTDVYKNKRARFYLAVFLEFSSRILMGVEIWIILHGVGIPISVFGALFLYALYSVIINFFFFVPLNLGVREGGLMLGLQSLAVAPLLGVYLGIVIRIRDFFWIAVGLLMILFTDQKKLKAQE